MNKKLLCTAVGASLAAVTGLAQAEIQYGAGFALVPYVVKDTNRTTVVTVIMDNHGAKGDILHIQYQTKSTTDANTAACLPSSVTVPVTENDIVTWDTAGILGYPLFGDTTNPAPVGMSISYAAPRHGYLLVQAPNAGLGGNNDINAAYWLELDLANGGAIGDSSPLNGNDDYADELSGRWVLRADDPTDITNNAYGTPVNFWPSSVASTAFTVTPMGSAMLTKENNQVTMQVFNNSSNPVQGAYDRNENGVDGTVPITVRCVGRVTPAQLMPGVVSNVGWAKQGGWGNLVNLGLNDGGGTNYNSNDLDAIVYQVDSGSAGGKFISNATRITTWQD